MEKQIQEFILQKNLFNAEQKLLVAVSGGKDSMVLIHILKKLSYHVSIAHCNFQLRGEESDADEQFVKEYGSLNNIEVFTKKFDTKNYSINNKLSIQETARKLRYQWFDELMAANQLDCIITAHHQDDNLETILYNLIKGSKFRGFAGIWPYLSAVAHPFLCVTRKEIDQYANSHNIQWRDDSSNFSNDYSRNFIRNKIVPLLKEINPSIEQTVAQNSQATQQYINWVESQATRIRKFSCLKQGNFLIFDIEKLYKNSINEAILFEVLKKWNFNYATCIQIFMSLEKQSGKIWESPTHQILKDRTALILRKKMELQLIDIELHENQIERDVIHFGQRKIGMASKPFQIPKEQFLQFDLDKVKFPIKIRPWKPADKIYLKGMKGAKKVSDLLTDIKLNLFEKEQIFVLENTDGQLISVDVLRVSNKFECTHNSSKRLIMSEIN